MTRQFYYRKALYNDWLSGVDKAALKALPQRDTETSNLYNIDSAIEQGIYSKAEIQAMRDFNEFARKGEHVDATYDSIVQSATETHEDKTKAEVKSKTEAAKETKNGVDYLIENVKPKTEAKAEAKPKAETKPKPKTEKEKAPEEPFTDEKKDAKIESEVKYEPRESKVGRLTKEVKEGWSGGNYARTEGDLWLEGAKRVDIIDELSLEMAHEKDPEAAKKLEHELLYWLKEYCSKYDYERLTDKWKGQMSNFEAWKVFRGSYSKFGLASDENLYSGIRSKIKEQKGETNEQKGKAERESKTASGERTSEILPDRGNDSKNTGGRAAERGVDGAKGKSEEFSGSSMATLPQREVASSQPLINAWGVYIGPKCDVDLSPGEVRYPELADAPSTRVSFKEFGDLDVIQEDSWPQDFRNLADEAMHQFDDYPPEYRPQVFLVKGKGGQGWAAFFQPESFQYDHTNSGAIVIPAEAPSSLRHLIMHESGHALDQCVPYEAVTFALAEKNRWQVKTVRMVLDAIMVISGVLLGGKFGVCTIITVIISGPVIQFVNDKSKRLFNF